MFVRADIEDISSSISLFMVLSVKAIYDDAFNYLCRYQACGTSSQLPLILNSSLPFLNPAKKNSFVQIYRSLHDATSL